MEAHTTTITFSGSSDDLIYCTGDEVPHSDVNGYCLDEASALQFGSWIVRPVDDSPFRVLAHYDGIWSFSISLLDEGDRLSMWASGQTESDGTYCVALKVTVPSGSTVEMDSRNSHCP